MKNPYERATEFVHLVKAAGDRHAIAIGPMQKPVVVGEPLPLGPAQQQLTVVRRVLAIAFEEARRDERDFAASSAERHCDDEYTGACCATTAREIAADLRR